jgi:hypothetical protein
MLWHAFMFLGLRPVGFLLLSRFCLVVSPAFPCKTIFCFIMVAGIFTHSQTRTEEMLNGITIERLSIEFR